MKISDAVFATSVVAILLTASRFCSAQDKPLGDVAREARAQKSEAHHAEKVVTNDDLSSDRGPVQESDDPVTVLREAWRAFLADAGHTCHGELTNNSGPGWMEESLIEAQGRDRIQMVKTRRSRGGFRSHRYRERQIRPIRHSTLAEVYELRPWGDTFRQAF